MQCPRCQQDNPLPDAEFCPRCGAPVKRVEESGPPAASNADLRRDLTEAQEQVPEELVRPRGFEPLAFGFVVRRSVHLS
jgi:hypothetical protein